MATAEVKAFRANLATWLLGITGMSAAIGTRLYSVWPSVPAVYPLVTYAMARRPLGDMPGGGWRGETFVRLYGLKEDELDDIEDLIVNDLSDGDVQSSLTDATKVVCQHFALTDIGEDTPIPLIGETRYVVLERQLTFDTTIVAREANY